jgi:uncharacterized damage-inducible protein DinB
MEMKQYLLDTFKFNDFANGKMLEKIKTLPDKKQSIKFFSHLINSQNKWLIRIQLNEKSQQMSGWEPIYSLEELEPMWTKSINAWLEFIESKTEEQIFEIIHFTGWDGGDWEVPLADIALQLNYHSIHHRAQIQMLIRAQGIEPDFIDYVGTRYKKIK